MSKLSLLYDIRRRNCHDTIAGARTSIVAPLRKAPCPWHAVYMSPDTGWYTTPTTGTLLPAGEAIRCGRVKKTWTKKTVRYGSVRN